MSLHDPAAKGEAETVAGNLTSVKAFEGGKYLLMKPRFDARTIVADRNDDFALLFLRGDMDARHRPGTKLQRVGNEVLQEQTELDGIRIYFREQVVGDQRLRLGDFFVKFYADAFAARTPGVSTQAWGA